MTERLKNAIGAGDVMALFPLLADWSEGELRALVEDCGAYYAEATQAIDGARRKELFTPEVFFSNSAADAVNRSADDGIMQVLAVTSEIASVAQYWLRQRESQQDAARGPEARDASNEAGGGRGLSGGQR